jgi:aerobic C4-dicarboxylate transport protein
MKTSLFKSLYFQVLTAIAIGILLGHYYPELGAQMKPLGDAFVKLIKMVIAPVIFCTVVTGIAGMESMKAVGRTGAVALLYFEVVSTLALIIGLIIVNVVQPGAGMNVDPSTLDAKAVAVYAEQAKDQGVVAFLLDVIPGSVIGAFASGNILQVLLFAVMFGFALHRLGSKGQLIFNVIESFSQVIFGIINMIMRLAPIGAFGAMAFTIGKYGVGTLVQLGQLIICFYITCILFVVVVLGSIARATGFNIFKFIRYIREELLIVLGTSSSESALPRVYRSGDQQPYGYFPSDYPAGGAPALLKRRGRRDGQWLYRAGCYYFRCGSPAGGGSGVDSRYRPLHVRGACVNQPGG